MAANRTERSDQKNSDARRMSVTESEFGERQFLARHKLAEFLSRHRLNRVLARDVTEDGLPAIIGDVLMIGKTNVYVLNIMILEISNCS